MAIRVDGGPAPARRDRWGALPTGVRHVVAVVAVLHGVAHGVGTSEAFSAAADGRSLDYLAGAWTVADPTALRAVGILWALTGAAFVLAGVATLLRFTAWPAVLLPLSGVSLVLCVAGLWGAVIGIPVNLALGAVALAGLSGRRNA